MSGFWSTLFGLGDKLAAHVVLSASAIALGIAAAPAAAQEWNLDWGGYMNQHVAFGDISDNLTALTGLASPDWEGDGLDLHQTTEIIFTPIGSDATRVAALLSGEIDMMYPVPVQDINRVNNNAGTSVRGPFETITDEMWQADLDLKLFASIRLCRLVLPGMKQRKWGRIINTLKRRMREKLF